MKKIGLVLSLCLLGVMLTVIPSQGGVPDEALVKAVSELKVSYNGYVIGGVLSEEQVLFAKRNLVKNGYPGTYKFRDETSTHVVVSQQSNMVLAVYREADGVDAEAVKGMLAELMSNFGDPSALAHDKIIYWVFGSKGKVNEEEFNRAKQAGSLDALVTVKLNSSEEFEAMANGEKEIANIYFLVSSQPILQEFIAGTDQ